MTASNSTAVGTVAAAAFIPVAVAASIVVRQPADAAQISNAAPPENDLPITDTVRRFVVQR